MCVTSVRVCLAPKLDNITSISVGERMVSLVGDVNSCSRSNSYLRSYILLPI